MPTLRPGDRFPNVTLATVGGPVELEERWRDGPLIVAFMRHFGCPFCREQLIQMTRAWDDIRSAGAGAVAIFQYRAESTRNFCHHRKIPFDCLGDPAKQAYDAVGLGRGRGKRREYLGPKAVKGWFRVACSGAVIGIPHGDIALRPATFVVRPGGEVVLAHYNEDDRQPEGRVAARGRWCGRRAGRRPQPVTELAAAGSSAGVDPPRACSCSQSVRASALLGGLR